MNNLWDLTSGISFHACIVKLLKFVKSICFKQCCQVCCILPQHKNKLARFSSTFFFYCIFLILNVHLVEAICILHEICPRLTVMCSSFQASASMATDYRWMPVQWLKARNQEWEIKPVSLSDFEWNMNDTCTGSQRVSTQLEGKPVWMRRLCFTCVFSAVTCGPFMEITTCFHVPLEKRISVVSINRVFDWLCARHSLCIHPVVNI